MEWTQTFEHHCMCIIDSHFEHKSPNDLSPFVFFFSARPKFTYILFRSILPVSFQQKSTMHLDCLV